MIGNKVTEPTDIERTLKASVGEKSEALGTTGEARLRARVILAACHSLVAVRLNPLSFLPSFVLRLLAWFLPT
jgi:hypothetical protein